MEFATKFLRNFHFGGVMRRITISVDDELAEDFERLLKQRHYKNRSEAFRDFVRRELSSEVAHSRSGECVAVVGYTFDHHTRALSNRMTEHQHQHTALVISSMHVHLNHDQCVEAVVMRGKTREVKRLAETMIAETGVENGSINIIPISDED